MVSINSQKKFVEDLADFILSNITCTHADNDVIDEIPGKRFLIGTLASRKEHDVGIQSDDNIKAASVRMSRLKVSILIKKSELDSDPKITIKATGSIYYRRSKPINPKGSRTTNEWKRIPFTHSCELVINSKCDVNFTDAINIANNDHMNFKKIPDNLWKAKIYTATTDFDDEYILISFNFENESIEPKKDKNNKKFDGFERTLFDCRLEVDIGNLSTKEFCDEYVYEGHKQRSYSYFLTTNCQARWISEDKKRFVTEHFGRFEQDNIRPKECSDVPGLDMIFANLASVDNAIHYLERFVMEMKNCHEIYKNNIPIGVSNDEYQPRISDRENTWGERKDLTKHFEDLINRVEDGVNLIKSYKKVKDAFIKTNETMNNYFKNIDISIPDAGWRIFQLAFFLSSIRSIVEKKDLDIVDVLHVDTGGGKTEAFQALVIFTMFYERSTRRKNGATAIIKFPLRMLSVQQLERFSGIIIHAEAIRSKNSEIFHGSPFSIGYFVGNRTNDFPDLYAKVKNRLYEEKYENGKYKIGELISPAPISKIISSCPLCPPGSKGNLRLYEDQKGKRIIHRCDKCGNDSYIYHSDREIYRWRPTVILSTVDKWGALARQRRVRNILGGRGSMCPAGHGFIPSGDKCEDKDDEDFQCDEIGLDDIDSGGPILSIQDEAHLLREGFGTIAAHFEGTIDAISECFSNHRLKHITMSATLNGTDRQIKELYNTDKYFIIPGRCPEGVGNQNDFFFKKVEGPKHIIYGLKPNLRDNHFATFRTLLHFAEFIFKSQKDLNSDPTGFCQKYYFKNPSDAQYLIKQYAIPLTYHLKKQDAIDMERLKDIFIGDRLINNFNRSDIHGTVLTGDSSIEELKSAIDKIRNFIKKYDVHAVDNEGLILPSFHSTSVISHGVDLSELNIMIFQGLPYSTSEYIQVLSRVGRKDLGIIFLWFYPNRIRDDSFYINFIRYHNAIDHQVRSVPIKRNSRLGLQQTISSMICAGIKTHISNKVGCSCYLKMHIDAFTQKDQEELIEFISKIYGKSGLDINIKYEVEKRINQIQKSDDGEKVWFPKILIRSGDLIQLGMRGLQRQLVLSTRPGDDTIVKRKGK